MKLTVKQLQTLINAIDFCYETKHGQVSGMGRANLRVNFPNWNEITEEQFGELRGKLVRERIDIDPEFKSRL